MAIELTREEAITIIRHLSQIEGFLFANQNGAEAANWLDYSIELLVKRVVGDKSVVTVRHEKVYGLNHELL